MALVKFTAIVDHISGKLNGNVFSKNKGGNYVRSRGTVLNPSTSAQNFVRSIFGSISQYWRDLTDAQRAGWNGATVNFPYQNRLGDSKTYTGKSLFQKLNGELLNIGGAIMEDPPNPQDVIGLSGIGNALGITLDGVDSAFSFSYALAQELTDAQTIVLEATPPLSVGVTSSPKNQFRKLDITLDQTATATTVDSNDFGTGATGNVQIFNAYTDKFGTPPAGSKVFIRLKAVNPVGQASPYFSQSAIVTEV